MARGPLRLNRDSGLTFRMFISMALLAAVYLAFMWVLLRVGLGWLPMLVITGAFLIVQYYYSDRVVLMAMGAREVSAHQEPELHAILEKLAALAGVPRPKVAVMDTQIPNAFATGRDPSHSVVAVTRGLMNRLDPEELEAVLAHEMTHVKNRDMTVITMATFFSTIAATIVQWAMFFLPFGGFGDGGQDENGAVLIYLVSFLVWIISFFLIRAISRYREYAADRGSAILTGSPSQLASALVKISRDMSRIPNRDLRQVENASALFIIPAVSRQSVLELFQTHPTLEHRLAHLRRLEEELSQ